MEWKWFWVLFLAFLLRGWRDCEGCWEQEKTALFQLKPFFSHIDDVKNYWVEGKQSSDCCAWERVECNNSTGRVIRLFLNQTYTETYGDRAYAYSAYYSGSPADSWYLNTSLFLPFEELKSLYLGGNSIVGCVDNHGFERLSLKLDKLEFLDLTFNYFNDSILSSLSELSSLKSLYLAENQFTGSNPSNGIKRLLKLNKMEFLDLRGNILGNNILSYLRDFTSLKSLCLENCGLKGTIDMLEFNNLINLKELYLANNEIASLGSLFQSQGQLRLIKLEVLGLSGNFFNNSIFSSVAVLSNLKSLYLESNRLEGSIHIKDLNALSNLEELDICNNTANDFVASQDNETELRLTNLKKLDLSRNLFNNSILSSLDALSNLEELYLSCDSNNYVASTGERGMGCSLPLQSFDIYPSLKTLYLDGFSLKGRSWISKNLQILTSLEELTLYHSSLSSDFVQDIGTLTSLKNLDIWSCDFDGSNFDLQNLTSLEELTLGDLSLSSDSIQDIGALTSLKNLDIGSCDFNGSSFELQNLTNLEEMTLEDLSLSSDFILDIGALTSLKNLKVYDCDVNGSLSIHGPLQLKNLESLSIEETSLENNFLEKIGTMPSLKFLSLSGCELNGTLDAQGLCQLKNLQDLDISSNNLTGNLPECFSNFTSLESLYLSSNQFSGNISAMKSLKSLRFLSLSNNYFEIPISLRPLFNLSKLKGIYVGNNNIYVETEMQSSAPTFQLESISLYCDVGSFPRFLYHQHDLRYVDLSNLCFKGKQFPIWLLENNTNLHTLTLANNSFLGNLKLPLLPHTKLSDLDISINIFNGNIPNEIGAKLPSLRFLNMSKNSFGGSIPVSIGDMNLLDTLDLSTNNLTGVIPRWMGNMSGLITLDLSNNNFSGGIPKSMGKMPNLEEILMANNHLEGPIPREFCQLNLNLKLLDLSMNNISGSLPSCFSPLWISQVHLSRNKLQGTFTNAFHNSTNLVTLDLSNNQLTGNIPNWIGRLSQLRYLLLNNNHFEDRIPTQLCKLGHLRLINLSNNNLSGTIPHCLRIMSLNHTSQAYVNKYVSKLTISHAFFIELPIEFRTKTISYSYVGKVLTYLSGIDLSCNNLTGEIPHQIKNFQNIIILNLSHNSLTGPIPPAISDFRQIESLDLSYNNLSGIIPSQVVGLYFLSFFSVAYNNLSGSTPVRTAQFATFEESSYQGNPFLCGAPLPNNCSTSGPTSLMLKASTDNGSIDMNVFYVSFFLSYVMVLLGIASVLYINPYWRRAWFHHIEVAITSCYYFLPKQFHRGNM
ncbi:hypothetical protein DITRI_Ditri10aG0162900 [Diplodiscus trichospermus]